MVNTRTAKAASSGRRPRGPRGEKYGNARRRNCRPHDVVRLSGHPTSAATSAVATETPAIQTRLFHHSVDQSTGLILASGLSRLLPPRGA